MRVKLIPIITVCFVLLALVPFVTMGCSSGGGIQFQNPIKIVTPTLTTLNLANGTIAVGPGNYHSTEFTVSSSMQRPTVVGTFSAHAALGDNIEVYIFNDLAFANWSHGSTPPNGTIYSSGRITTDNINVSVAPGTYYLIFSNEYSTFSTKQVSTSIDLEWYQ